MRKYVIAVRDIGVFSFTTLAARQSFIEALHEREPGIQYAISQLPASQRAIKTKAPYEPPPYAGGHQLQTDGSWKFEGGEA